MKIESGCEKSSNLDMAKWIQNHREIYEKYGYSSIEEFHHFTSRKNEIYEIFCMNNFFVDRLVEFSDLVCFMEEKMNCYLNKKAKKIICRMIEYILKNKSHSDFCLVAAYPEKIFFRMKEHDLSKYISQDVLSLNNEIVLIFSEHKIKTNLRELLDAEDWGDLMDFKQKVIQNKIDIGEVLPLKLKSSAEILRTLGYVEGLVECSVCMGIGKNDTFIFISCSHFFCKKCIFQYVNSKGFQILEQNLEGNLLKLCLNVCENNRLPCPKCKMDWLAKSCKNLYFLKIYI